MTNTTKFAPTHWISNYDLPENGQEVQIVKKTGESVECLFADGESGTYRLSELSLLGSNEPCSPEMKTITLKCNSQGLFSPASHSAPLGICPSGNASHYRITNIPNNVPDAEVLRLAHKTAIMGGFEVEFSQLGIGAIARAK
jgi:hypothetical protein